MGKRTILLVEDNPAEAALAQRALAATQIPHDLVIVSDGQQALDYLFGNAHPGQKPTELPALVLLDLHLPTIPGLEVLSRIRAERSTRRLCVVILSTSNAPSDLATAYDLGANGYLCKPMRYSEFQQQMLYVATYWLVLTERPPRVEAEAHPFGRI